ncbi:MAG: chemotaxis protein CheB, partial [Caulobacter sp.]|nr:chemotaxis protein CheB [Caulobacter sp.]
MSGVRLIVIGASAGAVQALLALLPALPPGFSLPVLVVVHVPPDRDNVLAPLLQTKCRLTVKEAEDKEPLVGGVIYFAPSDYHLL